MIIVTGAAGQIGRALVNELIIQGFRVCGLDKVERNDSINPALNWITLDLRQLPKSFYWPEEVTTIIHLAGSILPATLSYSFFNQYISANVLTTAKVLNACRHKLHTFIYTSSISIYGNSNPVPFTEDNIPAPVTLYGISKLLGEMVSRLYFAHGNNIDKIVILRLAQVYGPGTLSENALYRLIRQAINTRQLVLTCNSEIMRDYIYLNDVIRAFVFTYEKWLEGTYNVGVGKPLTMGEIADAIANAVLGCSNPKYQPNPEIQEYSSFLSTEKFASATGFIPEMSISEGIASEVVRIISKSSHRVTI